MKKIVSVLSVAALTLSTVFAADVTLGYNTKGFFYDEENKKTVSNGVENYSQTRSMLDQAGYDGAGSDLVISAKNDYAGFVLDFDPNAQRRKAGLDDNLDAYYAWMNFSNLQITTGKWSSRYVGLLDQDGGKWAGNDFARYKPGVIGGAYAYDVDNLTAVTAQGALLGNSKYFRSVSTTQKLSTALAYTVRPNDDMAIMVKGVLVDNKWGSTWRGDKDAKHSGYDVGESDISFFSGFATEFAFRLENVVDINAVVKSMKRDQIAAALFFRTLSAKSILVGLSYGADLKDYGKDVNDHNYREMAVDFRGHFQLSEPLCITTMNNLSIMNDAKAKGGKDTSQMHLWDMVSLGYKVNEQVFAQLTVEGECDLLKQYVADDKVKNLDVGDLGGFTISVIPGVKYSFNENATLTTGLKVEFAEVGASSDYKDSNHETKTHFSIPVVFAVSL